MSASVQTARPVREYWIMLGVMVVLTGLEVAVAFLPGHTRLVLAVLLLLALAQAVYFALFTMHLSRETVALRRMAAGPGLIAAMYALALVSEAVWRHFL
jgi:heme/copper-type cytochrome/quinol oxidase subunit 4